MERVPLERKVLNENDAHCRRVCAPALPQHNILCLNLISSPGSGKTSLLERTLESFDRRERVAVLTGDIQTENDAKRLGAVWISGEANYDRRDVPSGCPHDRTGACSTGVWKISTCC